LGQLAWACSKLRATKNDRRIGDLSDSNRNHDRHEQDDDERVEKKADQFGEQRPASAEKDR
jgi:hypothetical protein